MNSMVQADTQVKSYDTLNLCDAHNLAHSDLNWMHTAINHVRNEVQKVQGLAAQGVNITPYHLTALIEHLYIYEYLADNRMAYHKEQAEVYEQEI